MSNKEIPEAELWTAFQSVYEPGSRDPLEFARREHPDVLEGLQAVAEWARKQTLLDLADEAETSVGWIDPDDAHRAAVWISRRALVEGDGQ